MSRVRLRRGRMFFRNDQLRVSTHDLYVDSRQQTVDFQEAIVVDRRCVACVVVSQDTMAAVYLSPTRQDSLGMRAIRRSR